MPGNDVLRLQVTLLLLHGTCQCSVAKTTEVSIYIFNSLRQKNAVVGPMHPAAGNEKGTQGVEILYGAAQIRASGDTIRRIV